MAGSPPEYKQQPLSGETLGLLQRANQDQVDALTLKAKNDTASIMARYGTRLAMAGAMGGSPLIPAG